VGYTAHDYNKAGNPRPGRNGIQPQREKLTAILKGQELSFEGRKPKPLPPQIGVLKKSLRGIRKFHGLEEFWPEPHEYLLIAPNDRRGDEPWDNTKKTVVLAACDDCHTQIGPPSSSIGSSLF
jgi:hypothetical protein